MLRSGERIFAGNVEFIKSDIMQEHIDAAQIVGRDVDFLTKETIGDTVFAKHFLSFQQ